MTTRIMVTHKGEIGFLRTEVTLDLRSHYSLTLDPIHADSFPSLPQAQRQLTRVARRFEQVQIVTH